MVSSGHNYTVKRVRLLCCADAHHCALRWRKAADDRCVAARCCEPLTLQCHFASLPASVPGHSIYRRGPPGGDDGFASTASNEAIAEDQNGSATDLVATTTATATATAATHTAATHAASAAAAAHAATRAIAACTAGRRAAVNARRASAGGLRLAAPARTAVPATVAVPEPPQQLERCLRRALCTSVVWHANGKDVSSSSRQQRQPRRAHTVHVTQRAMAAYRHGAPSSSSCADGHWQCARRCAAQPVNSAQLSHSACSLLDTNARMPASTQCTPHAAGSPALHRLDLCAARLPQI